MNDELKQIHISDFYWFAPSESIITFAPKDEYKSILPIHRATTREGGEHLCKKSIWNNQKSLKLNIKYRFLIKGNFIPEESLIY
jgi:hypothetical protein